MIVIIGSDACLPTYRALFAATAEFTVEAFSDVLAALVAIGSLKPMPSSSMWSRTAGPIARRCCAAYCLSGPYVRR